jgi:uncharacterized Ntn-hydrolase superfamily protein
VTYSLVARDPETGELGVGVQSRAFRTGGVVPWAEPGVGAVATQSFTLPTYGPRGLDLLREGAEPADALAQLTAEDDLRDVRQVAFVDSDGRTATHTGSSCIPSAAAVVGDGFSAQGNMLRSDAVVEALADGYTSAGGTLAERLLAGLDAAEAAGGDFRGREAGAILVVPATGDPHERVSDLRVDNHPEPLQELRRLLAVEEALRRLRRAEPEALEEEFEQARAAGVDEDVARWLAAVALVPHDAERAAAWLEPLAEHEPKWRRALAVATDALERSQA